MAKKSGNNLYEPHPLMIDSGTFWRCRHGYTGWNAQTCWRCGIKHPWKYLRAKWLAFLETV